MAIAVSGGHEKKIGLVLSGGGARGAYQVGAVKAIIELAAREGVLRPIPILTGMSAGAINAALLACLSDDPRAGCERISSLWSSLTADKVFRTDVLSAGVSGIRFFSDAAMGALYSRKLARSLLDTSPLDRFLKEALPLHRITEQIKAGHVEALAITAMNYSTARSVTFVQGRPGIPMWIRERRHSEATTLTMDHIRGSAAIPVFFGPVRIGNDHFGDGCLRNPAPISPAIHLGAERLIVIGVRHPETSPLPSEEVHMEPSIARVFGMILNGLMLDSIDTDMERLGRVNETLEHVPAAMQEQLQLRKIDTVWIRPSRDIAELAEKLFHRLPRVIRYLMSGLGSAAEAAELSSYLLFDPQFCGALVDMGYRDAMAQETELRRFLAERG